MIKIRSVGGKFSKDFLVLSGYLFAFSSSLVLLITFLNAYFHGMKTLILIDSYGEATFELFLILPVFGVIVLGLSIYLVGFWRSHAKKILQRGDGCGSINMKDKHWFILYFPILYLTPPLHEMMHVLIGWAFGVSTIKVTLTMTYFKTKGSDLHWFMQHYVWDGYVMMAALSLFCVMLFIYLHLKSLNVKVNWDLIKRDLHIKKA